MTVRHALPWLSAGMPVVVAILGAGLTLSILKSLDSLALSFPLRDLIAVVAKAAAIDLMTALAMIGAIGGLSWIAGVMGKRPTAIVFVSISRFVARLLMIVFVVHAVIFWLRCVGLVGYVPVTWYWWVIALPALVVTLLTSRNALLLDRLLDSLSLPAFLNAALAVGGLVLMAASVMSDSSERFSLTTHPDTKRFRHVVLLTIDTLSAQHLSFIDGPRETSPNLHRLAERSRVFERFYANGNWTTPGMTSLATGTLPWTSRTGVPNEMPRRDAVEHNVFQLAESLEYRTGSFISNPNAVPSQLRLEEHVENTACVISNRASIIVGSCLGAWFSVPLASFNLTLAAQLLKRAPDQLIAAARSGDSALIFEPRLVLAPALDWLRSNANASTFTWIHLMPPHDPYLAPRPFRGRFDSSDAYISLNELTGLPGFAARDQQHVLDAQSVRYDESILYVDQRVGEFLDALNADPVLKDALVIVTADHGESFRHEYGLHGGIRLPEETIHIPLLIAGPGIPPGRIRSIHEQVDLLPTLAALMGTKLPDDAPAEGRALPLKDEDSDEAGEAYSMSLEQTSSRGPLTRGAVALIRGPYKYVHYFGKPSYPNMPVLRDELYDVLADPTEDHNLIGTRPDIEQPMLQAIRAQIDAHH